jgi:hypothetical protein
LTFVVAVICEADFSTALEYFHWNAVTTVSPTAGTNPLPFDNEPYVANPFVAFTNRDFKLNAVVALIVGQEIFVVAFIVGVDNIVVALTVAALTKGEVTFVVALTVAATAVVTVCVPNVALELTRFDSETPL